MIEIIPLQAVPTQVYTNCVAKTVGALEHQVLRISEFFALMLMQSVESCAALFGYSSPQDAFRQALFSKTGAAVLRSFSIDVSYEKQVIFGLIQTGVINTSKTYAQCIVKVTKTAFQILFLALTCPISLTLALSGLVMRAFVQNQMNPLTQLTPETQKRVWDGKSPLSICTFNGACTEFACMDKINGVSKTHERAPEIAKFLQEINTDIFCLQEFFDIDTLYPELAKILQKSGYYVVMTTKRQEVFGMTGGLFLASKYPITDVSFHEYTNRVGIDARTKKGVLAASISLNDETKICVGNTHMQAGYSDPSQKVSGRIQQFHEARSTLQALAKKTNSSNVFLAGDFNIGRFKSPELHLALFKDTYKGIVDGLLTASNIDSGYKDLTSCDIGATFSQYLEKESHFNTNTAQNNETGQEKGTTFNTAATTYIYIKDILFEQAKNMLQIAPDLLKQMIDDRLAKRELHDTHAQMTIDGLIQEIGARCYRKPNVCDHVAFMKTTGSVFQETKYTYEPIFPIGPSGILSDHMALKVTIIPHPKAKRSLF